MKKYILLFLGVLLLMPLAVGCGRIIKPPLPATYFELKRAFELDNVYFDFDQYDISPDSATFIQFKAQFMFMYSRVNAEIQGHCDERGTEVYNLALGDRRAKAAYNHMTSLGISGSRLSAVSYGEERPLDPAHNEAAWARNRRAQFVIVAE